MSLESTCRGKFTQLVANHVFRHEHGRKSFTIMNHECVANKFRGDRGPAGPRLDRLLFPVSIQFLDLIEKVLFHKRAVFN